MRHLLFILSVVFALSANAQDITDKSKKYFEEPRLAAYVGTWTANYEGKLFTLTLTKYKRSGTIGQLDNLIGTYTYEQDKRLISGSTKITDSLVRGLMTSEKDVVTILFSDPVLKKAGMGTLKFDPASRNRLVWNLNDKDQVVLHPKKPIKGYSVPSDLVLDRKN